MKPVIDLSQATSVADAKRLLDAHVGDQMIQIPVALFQELTAQPRYGSSVHVKTDRAKQKECVEALLVDGVNKSAVAREFGISRSYAGYLIKRHKEGKL